MPSGAVLICAHLRTIVQSFPSGLSLCGYNFFDRQVGHLERTERGDFSHFLCFPFSIAIEVWYVLLVGGNNGRKEGGREGLSLCVNENPLPCCRTELSC